MTDMISREAVLNLIRVNRTVSISKHQWAEKVLKEAFDELAEDVKRKPEGEVARPTNKEREAAEWEAAQK